MKFYMIVFFILVAGPGLSLDFSDFDTSGCDHDSGIFEVTIIANVQDKEYTDNVRMSAGCNWPILTQEGVDFGNDKVRWGRDYNVFIDLSGEHPVVRFDVKFSDIVGYKELNGISEYPVISESYSKKEFTLTDSIMEFNFAVSKHKIKLKIQKPSVNESERLIGAIAE